MMNHTTRRSSSRIRTSRKADSEAHRDRLENTHGYSHPKLLELPAEVRSRILRELLVHDGPLAAVLPSEIPRKEDDRLTRHAPKFVKTLEDIAVNPSMTRRRWSRQNVADLQSRFPGYSVRECLGALNKSRSVCYADSTIRELSEAGILTRYSNYSTPQVKLSRSILFVNRQLFREGRVILYEGNYLSVCLRVHGNSTHAAWDPQITFFDHRLVDNPHPRVDRLHPTLLKFTNLHFDIRLAYGADPSCARSILRQSVYQLNEKQNLARPRNITVVYEDTINSSSKPFGVSSYMSTCEYCMVSDINACQCERSNSVRNEAKINSLKILAPLRHLRNVKNANISGLSDESAQILKFAMMALDNEKPVDACGDFKSLLISISRFKVNDETEARKAYKQLNFPELYLKTSNHPLLAPFANSESDIFKDGLGISVCPEWIWRDVSVVKAAMYCDDVQSFYALRQQVFDRINETMLTLQRNVVFQGEL